MTEADGAHATAATVAARHTSGLPERRELRLAPVMTGGTSLAVWMGGVTAEIYRLLTARRHRSDDRLSTIYRELLDLTHTTPVVDVVTGTSAGGLNSTLLGAAWMIDLPVEEFANVREVWLDTGDLARLLRSPNASDPESLLRGDDYFAAEIRKELERWRTGAGNGPVDGRVLDLFITVTTIHGDPRFAFDDFGQRIGEQRYNHSLRFRHDHFASDDWPAKLAVASRTSASIPFVFEPSYLRVDRDDGTRTPAAEGRRPGPDLSAHASFGSSKWAVDGGVVVNLPLGEAIDRIFEQPASGELRRVILYIKPTPTLPADSSDDDPGTRPSILDSVMTVVSAPRAEGVVGDIEVIRAHNRRVHRQRAARVAMLRSPTYLGGAEPGPDGRTPTPLVDAAVESFESYLQLRALGSVSNMMDRVGRALPEIVVARQTRIERDLRLQRLKSLPIAADRLEGDDTSWGWGLSPLEYGGAVFLAIIDAILDSPPGIPGEDPATRPDDETERERAARAGLARRRHAVYDVLHRLDAVRRVDAAYWRCKTQELAGPEGERPTVEGWVREAYERWPDVTPPGRLPDGMNTTGGDAAYRDAITAARAPDVLGDDYVATRDRTLEALRAIGFALARELDAAFADMDQLARLWLDGAEPTIAAMAGRLPSLIEPADRQRLPDWKDEVRRTRIEAFMQYWALAGETPTDPARTLQNVLALHVLDTTAQGGVDRNEQLLELMQVSWDAPDTITNRGPDEKLAGPELGRLGAFLKRSWRANDWFWGRMDGTAQMIQLLLDPRRLRQLGYSAAEVREQVRALAAPDGSGPEHDRWQRIEVDGGQIAAELRFLDDDDEPTPVSLPRCAEAIAFAAQLTVAEEELPSIRRSLDISNARGGVEGDDGAFRLAYDDATGTEPAPGRDAVARLLSKMTIGAESAADEITGDILSVNAVRGATVAVKALSGEHAGSSWVRRGFAPLRAPMSAATAFITTATRETKFATATAMFFLATAGALLGARIAGVDTGPVVTALATGVFVAGTGYAIVRSRMWSAAPILVLLAVVGLALTGGGIAEVVTDDRSAAEDFPDDGILTLGDDAAIRLVEGCCAGEEQRFPDGVAVEITKGESTITFADRGGTEVQDWKRHLFLEPWALVYWLLIAATVRWGLILAGRARRPPTGVGARRRLLGHAAVWIVVAPAVWFGSRPAFEWCLTGGADEGGRAWIIDAAEWLERHQLWVVIAALVAIGVLIGAGFDRYVRRTWCWLVNQTRHRVTGRT